MESRIQEIRLDLKQIPGGVPDCLGNSVTVLRAALQRSKYQEP